MFEVLGNLLWSLLGRVFRDVEERKEKECEVGLKVFVCFVKLKDFGRKLVIV